MMRRKIAGPCSAVLFCLLLGATGLSQSKLQQSAIQAARWIESNSVETSTGKAWPVDPRAGEVSTNLYSGTAGIVLFFLELHHSTQDALWLREALAGADYLIDSLPEQLDPDQAGLYSGVSGLGFVFLETYKHSGEERFRDAARRCVQLLEAGARQAGAGVEWNDSTDIIGGSAGIGLFLLYAAGELDEPMARDLAIRAGQRLVELGRPADEGGVKWAMNPEFPRLMPNFSHGTAGNSYFLATLAQETGQKQFLEAALAGAKYLTEVADTQEGACLIFHDEPDGRNLYYLGWCHGPVGTARLFYRLWQQTGDAQWMTWLKKSAQGILKSGIPEKQTPGFWNNVSQCCGSAGVAEFFLDLHQVTQDDTYLQFSRRVTDNLLTRATPEGKGVKWIQAEHRVKPELLIAQTGYMQGAAGIGMLLLHLDAFEKHQKKLIHFPDSPF